MFVLVSSLGISFLAILWFLLIGSVISCIDKKSLIFKMLIVMEGMFLFFKEFVVVYFMRNIYKCIKFGGL